MLCKTFKMNSTDFTEYAVEDGLSVVYAPIPGLPNKYTLDGALHDDVLARKAIYTIRLNSVPDGVDQLILAEYDPAHVFLTIYDNKTGADKTVLCKTSSVPVSIALVEQGAATYWKIGDLTFTEM